MFPGSETVARSGCVWGGGRVETKTNTYLPIHRLTTVVLAVQVSQPLSIFVITVTGAGARV